MSRDFKVRGKAQEQLIEWGWYAVPHFVAILEGDNDELRAPAKSWLLKAAERIATGEEGGEVSDEQARRNAEINTENKAFKRFQQPGRHPRAAELVPR